MADLAVRIRAITLEREHFSEICKLKTFGVQRRPGWYVQLVAHMSYAGARVVTRRQTDYCNPGPLEHAPSVNNPLVHARRVLMSVEFTW